MRFYVFLHKEKPSAAPYCFVALCIALGCLFVLCACSSEEACGSARGAGEAVLEVSDRPADIQAQSEEAKENAEEASKAESVQKKQDEEGQDAEALRKALNITEDYRDVFIHGEKGSEYQKYIVLHDTEGTGSAASVVDYWASNGNLVAAHFVINKDGSIVQCVALDKIAHHAGFGDTGHNEKYGVSDESRDDKLGTTPIGSWALDYGMNSYSVGIEMVHKGDTDTDYPQAQLEALDELIAYIDAYYGFESTIIDHKAWRSGNSDTSAEFASYLANYQDHRSYKD